MEKDRPPVLYNIQEEHRADCAAFVLLEKLGYDFMIRSVLLQLQRGDKTPTEIDLVGVRLADETFDAFEFKVGTDEDSRAAREKGNRLRTQLRDRRDSRVFRHVWGAWDTKEGVFKNCADVGFGSLYVEGLSAKTLGIRVLDIAPELSISHTRAHDIMCQLARRLASCLTYIPREQVVFLACAGCRRNAWMRSY